MSLEIAAKKLAAKGRDGDSVLVHMHPQEVAGLQALARLHGTSMTVNPDTGLPEAFSLRSMLPMLAGAAMTYFSGGAIDPMTAAGLIGAGTGLTSGSLSKGITAGLGAYGGAGLGAGLASSAAESMGEGVLTETAQQQAAQQAAAAGASPAALGTNQAAATAAGQDAFANAPWQDKLGQLGQGSTWTGATGYIKNPMQTALMAAAPVLAETPERPGQPRLPGSIRPYTLTRENISGQGPTSAERQQVRDIWAASPIREVAGGGILRLAAGGAASTTGAYRPEQIYGAGQTGAYNPAATYGAGATQTAAAAPSGISNLFLTATSPTTAAHWASAFMPRTGDAAAAAPATHFADTAQTLPQAAYSAATPAYGKYMYDPSSGQFNVNPNWATAQEAARKATFMTLSNQDTAPYAAGGIASLGGYSDGGRLLRGPGDGVSDSIPATIGGEQPARLADGEFVVPARIVSELGNGSTEAGSKKLYAMLERVQRARAKSAGKNDVALDSKADRYLPA